MKQVIIGDVHGDAVWKKIIEAEDDGSLNRVIFIGDYFDSFNIPSERQIENFRDILERRKELITKGIQVIMLIGNHDFHYMKGVSNPCSGYKYEFRLAIESELEKAKDVLQMAFEDEYGTLYTHAGVSTYWLNRLIPRIEGESVSNWINRQFKEDDELFYFYPLDSGGYGDHRMQSPIWIRPRSLGGYQLEQLQVVGHTGTKQISLTEGYAKGGYWMVDTNQKFHYLTRIDKEFIIK